MISLQCKGQTETEISGRYDSRTRFAIRTRATSTGQRGSPIHTEEMLRVIANERRIDVACRFHRPSAFGDNHAATLYGHALCFRYDREDKRPPEVMTEPDRAASISRDKQAELDGEARRACNRLWFPNPPRARANSTTIVHGFTTEQSGNTHANIVKQNQLFCSLRWTLLLNYHRIINLRRKCETFFSLQL